MEEEDSNIIPRVLFKLYTPLSQEQYEVLLEVGDFIDITYYHSLDELFRYEGIDSDYTEDNLPIFEDLFAN